MAKGQQFSGRTLLLLALDTTIILAAVAAGAGIRLGSDVALKVFTTADGLNQALLIAAVCQVSLYFADLYDLRVVSDQQELFVRLLESLAAASIMLAAAYFWFPSLMIGRGVFLVTAALIIGALLLWRLLFEWVAAKVPGGERLLIIGTTPAAVTLALELLDRRTELGVHIVGFIDPVGAGLGMAVEGASIVGTLDDIPDIIRDQHVDRVVVSLAEARGHLPMDKLLEIKLGGVTFDHLATVYEQYTGKIALEHLRPSWLIFSDGFRKSALLLTTKRVLDIVVAAVGLALTAPAVIVVAVLVKLTSKGSVFYSQERVGLRGRNFFVYKFRSMNVDAEAATGPVWATKDDSRVTPIGTFLRRTRLDELPQLWNVLRGDMSMVGPRPERPSFVQELTRQIPFYGQRHVVKPGLTGWAQVRYTYGASVEDAMQKLQYDLYYIKNMSVAFDVFVMASTAKTVILRRGAA